MLLPAVGVMPHVRQKVGGRCNPGALGLDAAARKFDRCENQRSLGVANAAVLGEIVGAKLQAFLVDNPHQLAGERHDVHCRRALAEQHRDEFLITECCSAFAQQFLAWSIMLRDVGHACVHAAACR
jgi:hypothetical protein